MESRFRRIFLSMSRLLSATLMVLSPLAAAQAQDEEPLIQPQLERREITEPNIGAADIEIGVFGGAISIEDFGVNPVYGARVAYHVSESLFVEGAYGLSEAGETSYEKLSGAAQLLTDEERDYSYYNVSVGYNLFPGEAFWSPHLVFNKAFYLIGGIGSTTFAGDDRATVNVGFGYRLVMSNWFTLHVDMRDHMFDSDVLGEDKTTHNLETHMSITMFF